jgi:hypothetical protein
MIFVGWAGALGAHRTILLDLFNPESQYRFLSHDIVKMKKYFLSLGEK